MSVFQHIVEYEILENIAIDDKKYNEILQEIKTSQFKFKGNADHSASEYCCSFSEKKAETALYFKKVSTVLMLLKSEFQKNN